MPRTQLAASLALVTLAWAAPAHADLTMTVSPPLEQFAGSPVRIEASAGDGQAATVFQFSYRAAGGDWRVVSDFFERSVFDWTTLQEGNYEFRIVARDESTGTSEESIAPYTMRSRAQANPTAAGTVHPLVLLYSAPACEAGWMRVRYRHVLAIQWQSTLFQACSPGKALNFYIAGLRPNSWYVAQYQVFNGGEPPVDGPQLQVRSGNPAGTFIPVAVTQPPAPGASLADTVVLHSYIGMASYFPAATDLTGTLIWYYPKPLTTAFRPVFGGTMLVLIREDVTGRIVREIDLAGFTVRETNSTIVSEQLAAMGHDPIGVFHHEALRLANGHTLVLASVERILVDVQGPGPVNVYGEMIVELDENFQVTWAWNSFDHLDASRAAILGETCESESAGCPALFLAPTANDWLHANSIAYDPADGNIIVSLRHQDWVIKIDYQDGAGTGEVLWRLGPDGDFALTADPSHGPWPWFSHQHDARMLGTHVLLFDNGNVRVDGPNGIGGNSRGQVFRLDEAALAATLTFNHDLGAYSEALGSSQRLTNGNLFFTNGLLGDQASPRSEVMEVAPDGSRKFVIQSESFTYRALRMKDMYRP
jgi:hypothetical protein